MDINLNYFGQLGVAAGIQAETRSLDHGSSLRELIRLTAGVYGEDFARIVIDENGRPRSSVLFAVNGAMPGDSWETVLNDGDTVSMFPAIAGG